MAVKIMRMPLQLEVAKKHAAPVPAKRRYERAAALAHARAFWNRQCCDGYVAVKAKSPPYREVAPGLEFLQAGVDQEEKGRNLRDGSFIPWSDLDDCSHFVSCCIGRPYDALRNRPMLKLNPRLTPAEALRLPAGGLNVRSDEQLGNPWVYGIVGAPRLVEFLSRPNIGKVLALKLEALDPRLEAAVKLLRPGDVIALADERGYSHAVLYDGNNHIFCHTRCRNADDRSGESLWRLSTLARYTCIQIHDEIADGG